MQLQQVLLNLILNGMDALDAIAATAGRPVTARAQGAAVAEICVSDTGRGIAADEHRAHLRPVCQHQAEGIGMGLSISRTIVEAHGGRLWAENNADGRAPASASRCRSSPEPRPRRPRRA